MKKSIVPFLLLASVFTLMRCKVAKYTPDKLPARQLIIGNGGGFAGIETSYTLLENGQVFKKTGAGGAYEELTPVRRKDAKSLFEKLRSIQLYKLDIDKPGNLYYFIQEINETIDSRAVWGAGDYVPPQNVVNLYKEVQDLVKERKVIGSGKTKTTDEDKKTKEDDSLKW
jgi:hypothetical protein